MRARGVLIATSLVLVVCVGSAQTPPTKPDIPQFQVPTQDFDYEKRS